MHPALSIAITLTCLGAIIALSAWGIQIGKLSGELARKSVHVGMGLICMIFPWLFDSVLAVQLLAAFAIISLFLIRVTKLKKSLGSALFSIERLSIGELLFPLAVAWLFTLSKDQPVLYCISLLLLTLADTAGALAGNRFGKRTYQTTATTKSCEGSVAFLITAFLCIALPLHFFTQIPLTLVLSLSLTVSLFSMAVEGASGHGMDNLLIPLGSFLMLDYYVNMSENYILLRSLVLFSLLAILLITRRKHNFDGGTLLTAMLFGFSAFALGGIPCLLAAMILFGRHIVNQHHMPKQFVVTHSLSMMITVAIPSLFWLTLGRGEVIAYPIAQFGFICTQALTIGMLHSGIQKRMQHNTPSLIKALLLTMLVLTPALTLDIEPIHFLPTIALAAPLARFYYFWAAESENPIPSNWIKLGLLAMVASAVAILPIIL